MALVDHSQPHLFDRPSRHPVPPRQTFIDAALDAADEAFKAAYRELLGQWIAQGREFTGFEVTDAYKATNQPHPNNWRCVGGIYQGLVHRGVIEVVGYDRRANGNMTAVYRKKS